VRHRRFAQRRQIHPLQRPDAGRHRGRELPLLHHRAQRRRGRGARRAPAAAGGHRQARAHRAGDRRIRGHRRSGGRCQPRRGLGQPVSGPHPRDRRPGQRGALLRRPERDPRRRPRRSGGRHRSHPDRALLGRPGHGGQSAAARQQSRPQRQRQRRRPAAGAAGPGAGRAQPRASRCARWR